MKMNVEMKKKSLCMSAYFTKLVDALVLNDTIFHLLHFYLFYYILLKCQIVFHIEHGTIFSRTTSNHKPDNLLIDQHSPDYFISPVPFLDHFLAIIKCYRVEKIIYYL